MTSTGIYVGLSETKNSSKVIKPPGGGHTDIFGIHGDNVDAQTPSKQRKYPQSSIGSLLHQDKPITDQKSKTSEQEQKSNTVPDENTKPVMEETDAKDHGKEEQKLAQPKRGRVPPGGFSSVLW